MITVQAKVERQELIDRLIKCLRKVHRRDEMLFKNTLGEDCLNNRLGLYLNRYFEKGAITVDLEYNRHLEQGKFYTTDKRAVVDIVIHQRGFDGNNICAIECKRNRVSETDKRKIKSFISRRFNYQFGAIVVYNKRLFTLSWIENGRTKSLDVEY
jgi:hypothetical protein